MMVQDIRRGFRVLKYQIHKGMQTLKLPEHCNPFHAAWQPDREGLFLWVGVPKAHEGGDTKDRTFMVCETGELVPLGQDVAVTHVSTVFMDLEGSYILHVFEIMPPTPKDQFKVASGVGLESFIKALGELGEKE